MRMNSTGSMSIVSISKSVDAIPMLFVTEDLGSGEYGWILDAAAMEDGRYVHLLYCGNFDCSNNPFRRTVWARQTINTRMAIRYPQQLLSGYRIFSKQIFVMVNAFMIYDRNGFADDYHFN